MAVTAAPRDPRSIITPDAFDVSEELLGTPLASPRRRLVALVIDLAVIGVLIGVTRSFALILGAVVAILFIRLAFKRTTVRRSVFDRAMRFSVGCLGLFIGATTAMIWAALSFDLDPEDSPVVRVTSPNDTLEVSTGLAGIGLGGLLAGADAVNDLAEAESRVEAGNAVERLVDIGLGGGLAVEDVRATVDELVQGDHPWADEVSALMDDALRARGFEVAAAGAGPALDSAEAAQLNAVAGDTLAELADRIDDLRGDVRSWQGRAASMEQQLAEANQGGIFAALRGFVDELGFGFGWASLYLTVMLAWWNGQTIGKRMLGVRVVRLDGEPITWWVAFERGGGYAAGFATGLLGFAQVFWDANRQAIHDRIVGTVVVREGAEKVGNWEEAV